MIAAAAGHLTAAGDYKSAPPREWERFDPDLVSELDSFPRLIETTQNQISMNSSEREIMDVLYNTITERFTRSNATHNFFSNWLLYFAGEIHPAFLAHL